jgi:Fe2+ transport system protein A
MTSSLLQNTVEKATKTNAPMMAASFLGANPLLTEGAADGSMWSISQGARAIVVGFDGISNVYLQRMREIGIDIGAEIKCLNRPPFSAPRQFQICDGVFSLDKEIAAAIQVSFC